MAESCRKENFILIFFLNMTMRERERVLRKEKSFDLFMIGKKWLLAVGSNRNGWLKKGEP